MSHIVSIQTRLKDPAAVGAACIRLGLSPPVQGTATLYSGQATGLVVNLPGWQYPVVVNPADGVVQYDNFEGHWGDESQLHRLLQAYAVEKTRIEARKKGYSVLEQSLTDGSVKLVIGEGG